jgi:hypothetical protein
VAYTGSVLPRQPKMLVLKPSSDSTVSILAIKENKIPDAKKPMIVLASFYKSFIFDPVWQFETEKADLEMPNIRQYLILSVCRQ